MAFNPIVDEEKCAGCEECVDVCQVEVFEMQDGKSVPVNAEECLCCESCVEVCEEGAIVVEEIYSDLTLWSRSDYAFRPEGLFWAYAGWPAS